VRFTIIGAGGVGGCFGTALHRAGHEVTFFARGAHLDAIRRDGLTIRAPDETEVVRVAATDTVDDLPPSDTAIVAVKSYSLADVLPVARAAAERGATVLPLLNGVTAADELIAGGVSRQSVLGGIARISAARVAPGVVERRSAFQTVVLGELDRSRSARTEAIADAFRGSGIDARVADAIDIELWQKYVFISAFAAVCGMSRAPIGQVRDAPGGMRLIERAVNEVVAVARARGIELPPDEAAKTTTYLSSTLPAAMKPSFLVDLEAGGANELETLSGTVARLARELDVECPVHETATTVLNAGRY
jgi:2-dehydropantoate 2-reductase